MTHTKANKSKILTLILGLATCFVLMLGIVLANPVDTARAEETDPRIVVSTITATSNVDDIIVFGKSVVRPTFNIEGDVPALFSTSGDWQRKPATGDWAYYSGTAFIEGTYRYVTQIRIDRDSGGGTTHVLDKNGITVTVNGVKWADNSIPTIYAEYSYDWVFSKEYEVTAPAGTPLDFVKDSKWDIDSTYINQAITAFSVADGAVGGTKPYAFSKVSGPEWIDVAADGTVSGTPTALGANADLVIKVTDNAAEPASKEITLRVGNTYVLPADREVISVIKATSNIGEILGYGKRVVKPSFTFTEGTQANFSNTMGGWFKKEGTAWKRYTEATFTEGTYMYNNQLRVDGEAGRTHVLNKDGVSVYIDDKLCVDKQKPDAIYDTYSYIYVGTAEIKVEKPTTVAITDELVPVTDLEKVYNETAQEPTFGGTLVRDTDFEVSYAIKAGSTVGLDLSGKPVDAGTYVVTVTGKGAYVGSFTKEFVINKAAQTNVPVGLIANPISCREGSGTIDGVTIAMEYRKVGDTDYTKCMSSKITGLAAGEYQIRYAEDDNYLASADVTVTIAISHNFGALIEETPATCIADGMKAHYYCSDCRKYFDESKTEKTVAELTIPIDPDAHDFGAWKDEIPATCVATGTKGHQDCNRCNKHYDESGNEITDLTIPTNDNHDWNDWVSNGNGTHTRTCKRDSGHKENGTCSGGTATCTEQATCEKCNAKYGGTLGHNYGEVTYTWTSDNTCKAERVCAHDNTHVESEKVTATAEEIKAATCKEKGKMKYTATFTNKAFAAQVKEVDIDFVEHIYGDLIPEVPATADKTGTKKHYKCSVCGKLFDENKNEVTAADLVIPKIGTHNVVINGESNFYKEGESVTVTAEDKEGKEFVGWQDASGKIVSTQKEYTFVVKDGMVLTAVYQDKAPGGGTIDGEIAPAPDKNGLSGGQIAGIVIGSLAGVGIVGFAIFWFVVKKKSFADLIAAIKALFNKKQ